MRTMNKVAIAASLLFASSAFGSTGYEKATIFSAKNAGLANATSGVVGGGDAIYINPAGLVNGPDRQFSFSLAPTSRENTGPTIAGSSTRERSERYLSPNLGITAKYKLDEQWHLGWGIYGIAGSVLDFGAQDFAGTGIPSYAALTLEPEVVSAIGIMEFSVAAGYKINDEWNVGIGWRASFVNAELAGYSALDASTLPPAGGLAAVKYEDLAGQNFSGLRLGTQYNGGNWGAGFVYRTRVDFKVEGDVSTQAQSFLGGSVIDLGTSDVEIENALPSRIDLDFHYDVDDTTRVFFGVSQVNYSENEEFKVTVDGTASTPVPQNWKNSTYIRLAAEYKGFSSPLRVGYAHMTGSTDEDNASAGYTPAADTYSVTVGSSFDCGDSTCDYAFEFGGGEANDVTTYTGSTGDTSTNYYGAHFTYNLPW